jgi:hypothetical protein
MSAVSTSEAFSKNTAQLRRAFFLAQAVVLLF